MIDLENWIANTRFPKKPWMILGKGPTYSHIKDINIRNYNTFSLNHVVRDRKVDVAHIVDIDVVESCAHELRYNCDWLIMPRHPHVSCRPSEILTLEDWKNNIPILRILDEQGRLICYDLKLGEEANGNSEVEVNYFSSEAALGILAKMGAREVRSLGVDGGRKYSANFDDLETETKLSNGQASFDLQFEKLEKIAADNNMDYSPIIEPMLVFVGADQSQVLAAKVLEYSIHKHATRPVRVITMVDLPIPLPKDEENRARTGFSFYRFVIPELAKYRGRALYLDSDMLVFTDISKLWDIPFGKQKILCTTQDVPDAWKDNSWFHPGRQYSVMLLDCSRLNWHIDEIIEGLDTKKFTYADLMFDCCLVEPDEIEDRIPPQWNCLEHYESDETNLIHYTVIPTQPWTFADNSNGPLWERALEEAVSSGWISRLEIENNLEKGYLRESLSYVKDLAKNQDPYGEPIPAETPDIGSSVHLQRLVKEWRNARAEANKFSKQLMRKEAVLMNTKEKLEAALLEASEYKKHLDETLTVTTGVAEEYKKRVSELEHDKHALYKSKTWKLGRIITKPAEILIGK